MTSRYTAFLTASWMLLIPFNAWAAPAYGPTLPERHHLVAGVQSYTVFERKLFRDEGEMRSQQQFLLLSYGITDWLSLDLKGGSGDIEKKPDIGNANRYQTYVGGGYGFRIKWLDTEKTTSVRGIQVAMGTLLALAGIQN